LLVSDSPHFIMDPCVIALVADEYVDNVEPETMIAVRDDEIRRLSRAPYEWPRRRQASEWPAR
jgi:hypothetical protein